MEQESAKSSTGEISSLKMLSYYVIFALLWKFDDRQVFRIHHSSSEKTTSKPGRCGSPSSNSLA